MTEHRIFTPKIGDGFLVSYGGVDTEKARIISLDKTGEHSIVALITPHSIGNEYVLSFREDGSRKASNAIIFDAPIVPVIKELWMNVYSDGCDARWHQTSQIAKKWSASDPAVIIKMTLTNDKPTKVELVEI